MPLIKTSSGIRSPRYSRHKGDRRNECPLPALRVGCGQPDGSPRRPYRTRSTRRSWVTRGTRAPLTRRLLPPLASTTPTSLLPSTGLQAHLSGVHLYGRERDVSSGVPSSAPDAATSAATHSRPTAIGHERDRPAETKRTRSSLPRLAAHRGHCLQAPAVATHEAHPSLLLAHPQPRTLGRGARARPRR